MIKMSFFSKKPEINVAKTYNLEMQEIRDRVSKLERDIMDTLMMQKELRDKVLRKIQSRSEPNDANNVEVTPHGLPLM